MSPAWDLFYVVLTPLLIVPAVLLTVRHWLQPEQLYLAVISFASLGHHLPGFMRAYGDRELFDRYRWRFLLAPPLVLALALAFTPPAAMASALGLPWTHLHGLELILLAWGTWHGLMQTYGFMRIYDLRRGENDRASARLDHALCVTMFVAGVVFSDVRMFGVAGAMWQAGLPLFGPETLATVRWIVGGASAVVAVTYAAHLMSRWRRGVPINGMKLLLAASTGWFYWYCGRLSTNLLIGVAMFEIFHAVQYNAVVWIYNRRLFDRAGEKFGPLGFLFRDRLGMLGIYLAAIGAYSSIRFFTASTGDRMFSADLQEAHQWLIAFFVASSLLHFYYDGFIWKVSERKTRENLVDAEIVGPSVERFTPSLVHAGKFAMLLAIAAALVFSERHYRDPEAIERQQAERRALARLTPGVPESQMLASREALAAGDAVGAVAHARRAAEQSPDSHQNQAELGCAWLAAGEPARAKVAIERAIELQPNRWDYRCDLGESLEKLGEPTLAADQYRRAATLAPREAEPVERLANLYLSRKDLPGAVAAMRRLGKLDPKDFSVRAQLGDVLMEQGETAAAAEAYREAVVLRPSATEARICLADALIKLGDYVQAEQILREGLKYSPDSADLAYTLGLLLQHTGEAAEAQQHLQRAAKLGLSATRKQPAN